MIFSKWLILNKFLDILDRFGYFVYINMYVYIGVMYYKVLISMEVEYDVRWFNWSDFKMLC